MGAPQTYAEWMPLLDRFRSGDDSVLDDLRGGSIEWTNVVAERWTRQVSDCLTARLQALSKQLQTGLDRARGDYFAIASALLMVRRGLTPLRQFVTMPAVPTDVQRHIESELNRWIAETQSSLEKHGERVRHDQGRFLKTIRDHPLSAATTVPVSTPSVQVSPDEPQPTRGRRILL